MIKFNIFGGNKETKQQELEHLKKAMTMLQQNYEKKMISSEYYVKKNQEFMKKKEKLEKELGINNY